MNPQQPDPQTQVNPLLIQNLHKMLSSDVPPHPVAVASAKRQLENTTEKCLVGLKLLRPHEIESVLIELQSRSSGVFLTPKLLDVVRVLALTGLQASIAAHLNGSTGQFMPTNNDPDPAA